MTGQILAIDEFPRPVFRTDMGQLYHGDCLDVMPWLPSNSVDTVFSDPPFNLDKNYGYGIDDSRPDYLEWSKLWIDQAVRLLKSGGSFFLYNLPKWNVLLGAYLTSLDMEFRHWIAVRVTNGPPIQGRLYPAHYSILYYSKGKPKTFRKIRTPIEKCRHCDGDIKNYGGHRKELNPLGINLTDVWTDATQVSHAKHKPVGRKLNQLSTTIVRRCAEMSTLPGDTVLDPFMGSGTTGDVCERSGRKWIGVEMGDWRQIADRIGNASVEPHRWTDHVEGSDR